MVSAGNLLTVLSMASESVPQLEGLLQTSADFCQFLLDCCKDVVPETLHSEVFLNEFSVVAFPPGTLGPLSDFTGTEEDSMVVFSQLCNDESREKFENGELEECTDDNEATEMQSPQKLQPTSPFSIISLETVRIGQPLHSKRMFLTKTEPLYVGQGEKLLDSMISVHDKGFVPLSVDKARYLCSLYALGAPKTDHPLPSIWVMCDSEHSQKIVALGCSFDSGTLRTFTISEEENCHIPQNSASGSFSEKQKKRRSLNKSAGWAFSEYEINSCVTDEKVAEKHAQLILQFAWNDPDSLLSPPSEGADAVLKISASPGYTFSPVLSIYQELTTLLNLCKIACGESSWPEAPDEIEPSQPLVTLVGSFLEEASSPLSQPMEVTVISPTADHTVYEPRKDLDFVERLWMFAKEVQSLEDLQQVFAAVFKAVLLGKLQPFVHRSSTSVLAGLFREVLLCANAEDRQMLAPKFQSQLSGSRIVDSLVQLGIEKLRRDYRSFFVGSDLVTGSQLDHFFATGADLFEQCRYLCKLHHVLELNASALSFLNLPTATLSSLTKAALDIYRERNCDELTTTPVFCLPIPAYSPAVKSVTSLCANLSPKTWVLSAKEDHRNVVTVALSHPLFQSHSIDKDSDHVQYVVYKGQCVSICL